MLNRCSMDILEIWCSCPTPNEWAFGLPSEGGSNPSDAEMDWGWFGGYMYLRISRKSWNRSNPESCSWWPTTLLCCNCGVSGQSISEFPGNSWIHPPPRTPPIHFNIPRKCWNGFQHPNVLFTAKTKTKLITFSHSRKKWLSFTFWYKQSFSQEELWDKQPVFSVSIVWKYL